MSHTIEQFSQACSKILNADPGPSGRQKVCELLREALKDESFVAKNLTDDVPERKVLYEDPKLGFVILAHHYQGAKESAPHDHGPYWAIYGQGKGETKMTDWELVEAASEAKAGKVRRKKTYTLAPGMAYLYNEGDLHSPSRAGSTRLIRIEGKNMETVKRLKFEAIDA
jgi:predicted metal-dependent enzyme (double-stranded beta helix superfamily)